MVVLSLLHLHGKEKQHQISMEKKDFSGVDLMLINCKLKKIVYKTIHMECLILGILMDMMINTLHGLIV